jgi:hypothetical protein
MRHENPTCSGCGKGSLRCNRRDRCNRCNRCNRCSRYTERALYARSGRPACRVDVRVSIWDVHVSILGCPRVHIGCVTCDSKAAITHRRQRRPGSSGQSSRPARPRKHPQRASAPAARRFGLRAPAPHPAPAPPVPPPRRASAIGPYDQPPRRGRQRPSPRSAPDVA